MKKILMFAGIVLVLAFLWLQFGGTITGSAPSERPDLPEVPGPNDVADKTLDGAEKGVNWLTSLNQNFWQIISILILAGALIAGWQKLPVVLKMVIVAGIGIAFALVFVA